MTADPGDEGREVVGVRVAQHDPMEVPASIRMSASMSVGRVLGRMATSSSVNSEAATTEPWRLMRMNPVVRSIAASNGGPKAPSSLSSTTDGRRHPRAAGSPVPPGPGAHTWAVRLPWRLGRRPAAPAPVVDGFRPPQPRLYSQYIDARSASKPRPVDSARSAMSRATYRDPLTERVRGRLVVLLEQNQRLVLPDSEIGYAPAEMSKIAIELLVATTGDLSLRPRSGHPQLVPNFFDHLASLVVEGECPLALDAIGAWVDSYARLPDLPWFRKEEERFLQQLEEVLADTIFAVRGREIVLREDLGGSTLVDKPLAALVTSNPALRGVDDKLREALAELAAGNAPDAVTDAGTALQMLLQHLGYSGGQLGDQLKAARKAQWLSGVDAPLADAVDSLARWVASIRNQRSDAHHGAEADPRDAELVVRVVGLLVLRFG